MLNANGIEKQGRSAEPAPAARRRVLLHVCCAPCSTHAIETLLREYDVTLFFSNANIDPADEYARRLESARQTAGAYDLPLVEDLYNHAAWQQHVAGLEGEPERGARCTKCFEFNLARAADYARTHGFDLFTTTLTISPHKDSRTIFAIGERLGPFLALDFKKKDGFRHSLELSRKHGLYRQTYCGCEFSRRSTQTPSASPASSPATDNRPPARPQ